MEYKCIHLPVKDYLKRVVQLSKDGAKIYLVSERNTPTSFGQYNVYTNSEKYTFYNWYQFISTIVFFHPIVDIDSTYQDFYERHTTDVDRKVIVEYFLTFDIETVLSRCEELSSNEFKKWLKQYIEDCYDVNYIVDSRKSVNTILDELKKESLQKS